MTDQPLSPSARAMRNVLDEWLVLADMLRAQAAQSPGLPGDLHWRAVFLAKDLEHEARRLG